MEACAPPLLWPPTLRALCPPASAASLPPSEGCCCHSCSVVAPTIRSLRYASRTFTESTRSTWIESRGRSHNLKMYAASPLSLTPRAHATPTRLFRLMERSPRRSPLSPRPLHPLSKPSLSALLPRSKRLSSSSLRRSASVRPTGFNPHLPWHYLPWHYLLWHYLLCGTSP